MASNTNKRRRLLPLMNCPTLAEKGLESKAAMLGSLFLCINVFFFSYLAIVDPNSYILLSKEDNWIVSLTAVFFLLAAYFHDLKLLGRWEPMARHVQRRPGNAHAMRSTPTLAAVRHLPAWPWLTTCSLVIVTSIGLMFFQYFHAKKEVAAIFAMRGFMFDGKCLALVPLPRYAVTSIRTGQFTSSFNRTERFKRFWTAEPPPKPPE